MITWGGEIIRRQYHNLIIFKQTIYLTLFVWFFVCLFIHILLSLIFSSILHFLSNPGSYSFFFKPKLQKDGKYIGLM